MCAVSVNVCWDCVLGLCAVSVNVCCDCVCYDCECVLWL